MKKFILMVLAVAFAAAPAMAGDLTASGTFKLESIYIKDTDPTHSDAYFQDDFELITTFTQGTVSATIDWEIEDANGKEFAGKFRTRHSSGINTDEYYECGGDQYDIVDNFWITWKAADNITFKTGSYDIRWGANIALWNQGGHNLGITYALDAVDLGFTLAKIDEGWNYDADTKDADYDQYVLSANFKKAGPFSKLNFIVLYQNVEAAGDWNFDYIGSDGDAHTATFIGSEFAVPAGPVALSGELGLFGGETSYGDKVEGNYLFLVGGLKGLVGFDLNAILYYSSEHMFTGFGEFFQPLIILLNDDINWWDANMGNKTLLLFTGSYAVNDKLTVGGAILPYAKLTKSDPSVSIGMELDATYSYKFADNVTLNGGIGYFKPNEDFSGESSVLALYNKLTFKF